MRHEEGGFLRCPREFAANTANHSKSTVREIGVVFNVVIRISLRCYLSLPARQRLLISPVESQHLFTSRTYWYCLSSRKVKDNSLWGLRREIASGFALLLFHFGLWSKRTNAIFHWDKHWIVCSRKQLIFETKKKMLLL